MRPLLKALSAVSLILCFACLILGIRGIWQSDTISFSWKNWRCAIISAHGGLVLRQVEHTAPGPLRWESEKGFFAPGEDDFLVISGVPGTWFRERRLLGCIATTGVANTDSGGYVHLARFGTLVIPLWLMGVVFGAAGTWLPYRLWGDRRQRWLARTGRCPQCGYNLTGNTSGVCPECGIPTNPSRSPPL
jgi:hypothetical protein